ncbi:MAG: type II secretion system protein GspG [Gemmatimonadota bacterium]|jgi:hypothetical protein
MKTAIVILVLLGFAWGYPPTRARMVLGLQPVLHKLGPVGEMIVTPVERYSAKNEVNFILDQLQLTRTEGREIPDERTFTTWVNKRLMTKNRGMDPWNQPYFMLKLANSLTVGSIGEDGVRGSEDDIKKTIPF